jgi:predicted Zn-dependent protease
VVVGRKLVEALPEDDLLAAALAHELAHNLLGHRARLDASGRSWSKVKATEREADRLSVWLLANAGYDPAAAVRFFERWGPKFDLGLLATPDHDGWKTRRATVAGEIANLRAAQAANGGAADWSRAFKPGE